MKVRLFVIALLVGAAVVASMAYQAAARDKEYRALVARGDLALRDDQTFGAIEAYSGAIALRPTSMIAHLRRGETYQRRGDLDAAARDLRTAATLDSTATRPLEELGDVLYLLQRVHRAADTYAECLRLDDRSARVTYKLALAQYRDGNADAALATLDKALALDPAAADVHYLRGLCLRDAKRAPEAEKALERAIALAPGLVPAREELSELYEARGSHDDAIQQLQVVAGIDREHPEREVALGRAYARAGQTDLAVLTLGRLLERSRAQPAVYEALGEVWLEFGEAKRDPVALSKAVEALARAAEGPTASSRVLTLYGRALLDAGQVDSAQRVLRLATDRYPIAPEAFLFFASVSERLGQLTEARTALMRYGAIAVEDSAPGPRAERIASLALRGNDLDAAVTWYRKAIAAAPGDPRLTGALVDTLVRKGDRDGAANTVRDALARSPRSAPLEALARRLGVSAPAASGR